MATFPQNVFVLPPEDDIPGVRPDVAEKIYESLQEGRRYFGSSGASLTHQVFNAPEETEINPALAKVGMAGERSTTEILKEWMKDKPNVVLVDSVHINQDYKNPETEVEDDEEYIDEEMGVQDGKDTDHVLIIGRFVILVDTKRWKSKKVYSIDDDGSVLRVKKKFSGSKVRMRNAMWLWRDYLYPGTSVAGFVFINTEDESTEPPKDDKERKTIVIRNRNWFKQKFRVVEKTRFLETLDHYIDVAIEEKNADQLSEIDATIVSQVVVSAIKPFDARKRVINQSALEGFR